MLLLLLLLALQELLFILFLYDATIVLLHLLLVQEQSLLLRAQLFEVDRLVQGLPLLVAGGGRALGDLLLDGGLFLGGGVGTLAMGDGALLLLLESVLLLLVAQ